ncbi:MAG: fatty acid desaturase family protein [Alphaproteobacteria bacterium]|nr:fatty acid desaturase family protein [Alphaproteobacteria bacterium]MDE2112642.1 fatty acid desaturase family protein [Alphaproteobacteria bacterium]MDE2493747.1 fatty acid desaturase family protein [Alphaproteobacteria bacterium]
MNVARFDPTKAFTAEEMAAVRQRSDGTGLLCIVHAWFMIAAAMTFYALWPTPYSFILAVIVIGSRQLGLEILMHDGAHGVLMKTRGLNEWASQWLCAYPVFTDTVPYRHYHLVHHRATQQPDDPDLVLSSPFPITRWSFLRKMLRDLTGMTGAKQRFIQFRMAAKDGVRGFFAKLGRPLVANLILFLLLWALGKPLYYPLFWLLPLFTWHMAVVRVRSIAEHAMVPDNDDPMRNARTTYASWLERALFAPYWVNYHVDHHLLMYVPCFNLPKLHALLLEKGNREKMEIRKGYAAVLRLATSKRSAMPLL